jgi:hypothetical protein
MGSYDGGGPLAPPRPGPCRGPTLSEQRPRELGSLKSRRIKTVVQELLGLEQLPRGGQNKWQSKHDISSIKLTKYYIFSGLTWNIITYFVNYFE